MRTVQSTTKTTLRISIAALAAAALLAIAGPAEAQQVAIGAGLGGRATIRPVVGMVVPVRMNFQRTAQPTATKQDERFTEYVIRYTVASNARWEVAVIDLPQGVTVLAVDGTWVTDAAGPVVVEMGAPTNPTEVLVRVRVADGAAVSWQSDLNVNAGRLGSF